VSDRTIVAERLRLLRQRAGLEQAALAEALGRDVSTISRWERRSGTGEPSASEIRTLTRVLRCSADELLGLVDLVVSASMPAGDS